MSEAKFEKNSPEWKMFRDLYQIIEKYWIPEDTDEYWNSVIDATDDFTAKYHQLHPMVVALAAGVVSGLELKSKMDKENKDG